CHAPLSCLLCCSASWSCCSRRWWAWPRRPCSACRCPGWCSASCCWCCWACCGPPAPWSAPPSPRPPRCWPTCSCCSSRPASGSSSSWSPSRRTPCRSPSPSAAPSWCRWWSPAWCCRRCCAARTTPIHLPVSGRGLTLGAYLAAYWLHQRTGRPGVLSPVLVTTAIVATVLLLTGLPYQVYLEQVSLLTMLLGPATVALALPLLRNGRALAGSAPAVTAALVAGGVFSIALTVGVLGLFDVGDDV